MNRMRDYVVATTTVNILDWHCAFAFDASPSAYAALTYLPSWLCGEGGHPSIAKTAEILLGAVPRVSLKTVSNTNHCMMARTPLTLPHLSPGTS
jgi:hypothetical protein